MELIELSDGDELDLEIMPVKKRIGDATVRMLSHNGSVPGLYFLGLTWQHTRGSALIGWVKDDAAFIAEPIASYHPSEAAEAGRRLAGASTHAPRTKGASDAGPRLASPRTGR